MNTDFIKGVVVPILTPIDGEERIDEARLRDQVDYVIDGGVSGILAFGSNGEFYMVEEDEMERGLKSIISHHFPPFRWKRYVTSILLQCRPCTLTGIFCSEFASRWDFHRLLFAKLMNRKRYSPWSVWVLVSH